MDSFFIGTTTQNQSTSATNYAAINGKMGSWSATENDVSQVIPHALTISNLRIDVATAPGASKSYAYTVQKNGSDTGLTVTISGTTPLTQTDNTHTASFSAGDTISLKSVPAGSSPTAPSGLCVSLKQTSASGQAILYGTCGTQITAGGFISPVSNSTNATELATSSVVPYDGTVSNLWLKTDVDPGGSATWTTKIRLNEASISPTIQAVVTHGQGVDGNGHYTSSDTTNTHHFTAGQRISTNVVIASISANCRISGSFTWNPDVAGKAMGMWSCTATTTTNATRYCVPSGCDTAYFSTEGVGGGQAVLQACTLETLYLSTPSGQSVSPGTYAVTARANSTTDTALTATISATAASITGQAVTVSAGDKYDLEIIPASSPTARNLAIGVGYYLSTTVTSLPNAHQQNRLRRNFWR